VNLEFTFKDVFRAARPSSKRIWVAFEGIFIAAIIYAVFSYLTFLTGGWGIKRIWQEFRFLPMPLGHHFPWYSWLIWIIGLLGVFYFYAVTTTAIAKIQFEQLRGDEFYETREAWRYAFKNWQAPFLSPITLIFFSAILILIGMCFGLVGRIPYVGQIAIGCLALPIIAGALFVVYLGIVLVVTFLTANAIVATTEGDTFDTIFESFSLINEQTWRYVLWQIILGIVTFVGTFIFAILLREALHLTRWALGVWQGPRGWWNIMWNNAHWYLHITWIPIWVGNYFPSLVLPYKFISAGASGVTTSFGGFLLGLSFYVIVFVVLGYAVSTWVSGQTIIYIILVKLKDEKNLLEKKEEIIEEEIKPEVKVEEKVEKKEEEEEKKTKKKTTKKKTTAKKTTKKKTTTKKGKKKKA